MMWQKLNETAFMAEYAGWMVTKNYMGTDLSGRHLFEFIATKDGVRYSNCSWEYVKKKILKTTQTNLFQ